MKTQFVIPIFSEKQCLEFRMDRNVACIYGTVKGLSCFAKICRSVQEKDSESSFIINDHFLLLTSLSLNCYLKIDKLNQSDKKNNSTYFFIKWFKKIKKTNNYTLNFQFIDNMLSISGTANGFLRLADLCDCLIKEPSQGHIHLENECYPLNQKSLYAAIAIFSSCGEKNNILVP